MRLAVGREQEGPRITRIDADDRSCLNGVGVSGNLRFATEPISPIHPSSTHHRNRAMPAPLLLSLSCLFLFLVVGVNPAPAADWKAKLRQDLPLLGHRNWIVVADSAYPLQVSPGIETVYIEADALTVVQEVLGELAKAKHVQPVVYTDAELPHVAEKNAPGVTAYREGLKRALAQQSVRVLPHEEIIARLDEAGKTFKVLLLKTPLAIPYTSVFLQLECGYWNAGAEQELRAAMKAAP